MSGSKGTTLSALQSKIGKRIIPMYKSLPPYMPFPGGYGYLGVILLDTKLDNVQCHICGVWLKAVGYHVKQHGLTSKEYKLKIGVYKKAPLMGISLQEKFKLAGKKAARNPKWKRNFQIGRAKSGGRNREHMKGDKHPSRTYAFKNKFGTCEEQLKQRLIEALKINENKYISVSEPLLYGALVRRFGTYDKALEFYGLKTKSLLENVTRLIFKRWIY